MRFLILTLSLLCITINPAAAEVYRVDKVINGHTLLLSNKKVVRLIGIEAPDQAAISFLKNIVEGKGVKLEFDQLKENQAGELLAYVLLIETNLNATMLYAGYAIPHPMPPNSMHDEFFRMLYEDALNSNRGLWSHNE